MLMGSLYKQHAWGRVALPLVWLRLDIVLRLNIVSGRLWKEYDPATLVGLHLTAGGVQPRVLAIQQGVGERRMSAGKCGVARDIGESKPQFGGSHMAHIGKFSA